MLKYVLTKSLKIFIVLQIFLYLAIKFLSDSRQPTVEFFIFYSYFDLIKLISTVCNNNLASYRYIQYTFHRFVTTHYYGTPKWYLLLSRKNNTFSHKNNTFSRK